jgi:hypothetical protein
VVGKPVANAWISVDIDASPGKQLFKQAYRQP